MQLLGFDFFLTRGLYGARRASHFDLYRMESRWYFLEVGDWTLEVTTPRVPRRLVAGLLAFPVASAATALPDAAVAAVVNLAKLIGA